MASAIRFDSRSYATYLLTDHWRSLRAAKMHEARGRCQVWRCGAPATEVHHSVYLRCPFNERTGDLVAVCRYHHRVLESLRRMEAAALRRGHPRVSADFREAAERLVTPDVQLELPL